jgi:hypothetical protein
MITNFNYNPRNLLTPVVFREDFQVATLSATQAWSLFFSAGQEENLFGENTETGWFFNNLLLAGSLMLVASVLFTKNFIF